MSQWQAVPQRGALREFSCLGRGPPAESQPVNFKLGGAKKKDLKLEEGDWLGRVEGGAQKPAMETREKDAGAGGRDLSWTIEIKKKKKRRPSWRSASFHGQKAIKGTVLISCASSSSSRDETVKHLSNKYPYVHLSTVPWGK